MTDTFRDIATSDPRPNLAAIREMARRIIGQKQVPLPLPMIGGKFSKKPILEGWQNMTITADQVETLFIEGCNIGLRLDVATDCDLDCWEAVQLAPFYLKLTAARFGHLSKRNSHHLYLVEGSKSVKFENAPDDPECKMLCEIRHGSGFQTMIPPSVHPSGEPVSWEGDPKADAATWDYPSLVKAMGRIAGGALLAKQLRDDEKTHNLRHHVWLYIGGAMARADWPREEALKFCELVCNLIGDKTENRRKAVETSYENKETGEKNVAGLKKLEEYLAKDAVRKLAKWLDLRRSKVDDLDLSDDGNAQTLYAEMGDDLHYLPNEGKGGLWLKWNGTIWSRDHLGLVVHQSAEALKRKAEVLTAKSREGKYIERVRSELMNMAGINAAMARLAVYPEIASASDDFDSNPWLIGCQNGVYNLELGRLEHGMREHMVSRTVTASYNHDAKCPRWLACLERAQPDPETRAFLKRVGGAVLIGEQTEHGFIFNYGSGANFKTAFSEVLRRNMGPDYAMTPNDQLFFKGNTEVPMNYVADIYGMRLLTTNEREEGSEWNVSFIKKLMGGQQLTACRKYCESFGFVPTARVIAAANNKPRLNELDEALRRRFLMVPWDQRIPDEGDVLSSTEKDPATILHFLKTGARIPFEHLMELLMEERDGIFLWMTEGCRDFMDRGLRLEPPAYIVASTEDYFSDEDKVGRFVRECCTIVPVPSGLSESEAAQYLIGAEHGTLSSVIYRAFQQWAQTGKYTMGVSKLTRRLQKVDGVVSRRAAGNRMYFNLILSDDIKTAVKASDDDEPF
jgi:putative DNA primase/helicase